MYEIFFWLWGINVVIHVNFGFPTNSKTFFTFIFQDGRIDYNEFVAMMQKDNPSLGKKDQKYSFSIGFREALPVCWDSEAFCFFFLFDFVY